MFEGRGDKECWWWKVRERRSDVTKGRSRVYYVLKDLSKWILKLWTGECRHSAEVID